MDQLKMFEEFTGKETDKRKIAFDKLNQLKKEKKEKKDGKTT